VIQIFSNSLGEEELAAIRSVFESRWLGKGPHCANFEKEMAAFFGTPHAMLLNCCTAGIYIGLRALGIKPGDEVIVPTLNFVAIANAVIDLGAKPVFADVDLDRYNVLPSEIERLRTKKTKALFMLHYGGHAAAFDEIKAACGEMYILEDAANAVATKYHGQHCGSLGDIGVFSFDAMKILVMGDGGALLAKDPAVFEQARFLSYLGLDERVSSGQGAQKAGRDKWWEYDLEATSGRFISNDILASIGRIQLRKLPGFIARRKEIWDFYQKELAGVPGMILPPEPLPDSTSSYYLFWVRVPGKRDELAHFLKERGIYTTFRYYPLHLVGHYGDSSKLPNAERISNETINIPLHQNLSDDEAGFIVDTLKEFFGVKRAASGKFAVGA
jgi:aminotransferase